MHQRGCASTGQPSWKPRKGKGESSEQGAKTRVASGGRLSIGRIATRAPRPLKGSLVAVESRSPRPDMLQAEPSPQHVPPPSEPPTSADVPPPPDPPLKRGPSGFSV